MDGLHYLDGFGESDRDTGESSTGVTEDVLFFRFVNVGVLVLLLCSKSSINLNL